MAYNIVYKADTDNYTNVDICTDFYNFFTNGQSGLNTKTSDSFEFGDLNNDISINSIVKYDDEFLLQFPNSPYYLYFKFYATSILVELIGSYVDTGTVIERYDKKGYFYAYYNNLLSIRLYNDYFVLGSYICYFDGIYDYNSNNDITQSVDLIDSCGRQVFESYYPDFILANYLIGYDNFYNLRLLSDIHYTAISANVGDEIETDYFYLGNKMLVKG